MLLYLLLCLSAPLLWGIAAAFCINGLDRKINSRAQEKQAAPEMYEI